MKKLNHNPQQSKMKNIDHWNELIKVRDNPKTPPEIKNHAQILLGQLNTASGQIVKPEIETFLENITK